MNSTWQTGVANARLEFSGEAQFKIFTQKWQLRNIKGVFFWYLLFSAGCLLFLVGCSFGTVFQKR